MKTRLSKGKRFGKWTLLLALLPLLSACGFGGNGAKNAAESIDPPPSIVEQTMLQGAEADSALGDQSDVVTVYLLDANGYLAPMSLRMEGSQDVSSTTAEKAIAWMTVNKRSAEQLPPGFAAVLPEGTSAKSVVQDKDTISVDFVAPFSEIPAKQERKVIEALVWTLTELPGVDKVKLSVGGKPIRSMPASKLPVDSVLTRGFGINVESAADVELSRSMGVTLYFSAQTKDGEGYFVPVTRLINRQADPAKAALEQLISGPLPKTSLKAVLTSDLSIEKLSQLADTVDVSLKSDDWSPQSPVPAEMMEALVLTLTEATGAPQVLVAMNGDDALVDSDNKSYDHPVTRPAYANALSR
ncbi:GerMN domain-containing protein [Cohnella suwonensis]|uniref:GerMN domain-containing protein n=1 Tax=Cohnella suwonensis TaxID=696072 RepID=A0ABW0LUZ4_9BACL